MTLMYVCLLVYLAVGLLLAVKVGLQLYVENKLTILVGARFGQKEWLIVAGVLSAWLPLLLTEMLEIVLEKTLDS